MQHLVKRDENLELIWQGDPAIWPGQAPHLFPIVGELPNQTYTHNGKTYQMQRHGFARRKVFKLVNEQEDKLVFELREDEQTLAQYPFRFSLLVAYKLEFNKLSVTYLVRNEDDEAMWFSVGGHPGFNVPLYPGENYTDYYLEFEQEETLSRYLLNAQGLLSGDTERMLEAQQVLPLSHQYFEKDAIVLKELKSDTVTLASKVNPRRIQLAFTGFPYLGIWAKPGSSPFICIEPWHGLASRVGASGELREKEGVKELGPKQAFERTFTITVF